MGCVACDEAQEVIPGNLTGLTLATFVRVGPANVLISGCEEHLRQLLDAYREGCHAQEIKELES